MQNEKNNNNISIWLNNIVMAQRISVISATTVVEIP